MKNQWNLIAAILYGGVMMYGTAGVAGASGTKPGNQLQAPVPNASSQGEAPQRNAEPQGRHEQGHVHRHGHGRGPGGWNHHLNEKVAKLLGITPARLENELGQGKSLVDIAKSKGIKEEQLIDKLKNEMTVDLKRLVNRKGPITFDRKSGAPHEAQLKREQGAGTSSPSANEH
ncbi:UNVERIFIED_CONTAM: alkylated DNA nucleotide flippase Atl1 [Paenibacillus sp. PvR008]